MASMNQAPEGSRDRILQAAAEVAAERGYDGTTIARICEQSGLPASSVYWFFADKEVLFSDVVSHSFEEWNLAFPEWNETPAGTDPLNLLEGVLHRSVRSLTLAPAFLRIGLMLVLDKQANHPAARNTFLEIRGRVRDSIISMFTQSLAPELLDAAPELPDHLTTLIIALSDGYFLSVQLGDALDPDVFVEIAMSIVETAIRDAELEFL